MVEGDLGDDVIPIVREVKSWIESSFKHLVLWHMLVNLGSTLITDGKTIICAYNRQT